MCEKSVSFTSLSQLHENLYSTPLECKPATATPSMKRLFVFHISALTRKSLFKFYLNKK